MGIHFEPSDTVFPDNYDLHSLLNPAAAFAHPSDVVRDVDLTIDEKRAILASWASDACAVESSPTFRILTGTSKPVTFDDVMDALRVLDEQARSSSKPIAHYRRVLAKRHRSVGRGSATTDE